VAEKTSALFHCVQEEVYRRHFVVCHPQITHESVPSPDQPDIVGQNLGDGFHAATHVLVVAIQVICLLPHVLASSYCFFNVLGGPIPVLQFLSKPRQ